MNTISHSISSDTFCEITPDYELSTEENKTLCDAFDIINADPYRHYDAFKYQTRKLIEDGKIPKKLIEVFKSYANSDPAERPFIFIRNMPIDQDVKPFDNNRPVHSKYEIKNTFLAEASLSLIAHLTEQTPIGYLNVNGGDVFQDIYPAKSMSETQSQKAIGPIYFHKDLANHYVRPDYVNMLSMRSTEENEIFTTFVRNIDVLSELSDDEIAEYRKIQFYTPFDDLTVLSGKHKVGEADNHPIISGDNDIRFFENRTIGIDEHSNQLVKKINNIMHKVKKRVQMMPGDFIGCANNYSVHGKEVGAINAPDEAWQRWTMKTVNVDSIDPHTRHIVPGSNHLIVG